MLIKECGVLVIGSGGAGLKAAAAAAGKGADVLIVCKGSVNRSGATLLAGANVSADIMCDGASLAAMGVETADAGDSKEKWYQDIIHEGVYLNDRSLVRQYVERIPECVRELLDSGVKLSEESEGGRQIGVPGSSILDILYKKVLESGRVDVCEDSMLTDLLKAEDGSINGAMFLDIKKGELFAVNAKAVILATGGMHGCYSFNTGTTGLAGAGQAAAIRAGADLTLMEMVTFCSDVICAPERFKGNIIPYIMQCFGYGKLLNRERKEFLDKYLSERAVDLALNSEWNKLLLCYAMFKEVEAGYGDENGGVKFSLDYLSPEERDHLMKILPELGNGIYREIMDIIDNEGGISVYGAGHYFDGGIKVDSSMNTSIAGLFAAGECAGGLFGANRVGAATSQMLVQGLQAGESAAEFASKTARKTFDEEWLGRAYSAAMSPVENSEGLDPRKVRAAIVDTISRSAGIVRNETDMKKGLVALEALDTSSLKAWSAIREYNRGWIDALEARDMKLCGEAILKCSLARKESRGVFIRSDYMYTDDDEYLKATIYNKGNVNLIPVKQCEVAPPSGIHDFFENLEAVLGRLSY